MNESQKKLLEVMKILANAGSSAKLEFDNQDPIYILLMSEEEYEELEESRRM